MAIRHDCGVGVNLNSTLLRRVIVGTTAGMGEEASCAWRSLFFALSLFDARITVLSSEITLTRDNGAEIWKLTSSGAKSGANL
jgi:hypothetical protein